MPLSLNAAIQIHETLERINLFQSDAFKNLCESLERIDEKKQEVIAHIFSRMYFCTLDQYPLKLEEVVRSVSAGIGQRGYSKLYVAPLRRTNQSEVKSGDTVAYTLKASGCFEKHFSQLKVEHCVLPIARPAKKSALIIVDDYVGTGRSVKKFLDAEVLAWDMSDIFVCSIACHSIGFEYLDSIGIEVFAADLRDRSITDCVDSDLDKKYAIEVMRWFAAEYEVDPAKILGYGNCEANDVLMRVPNNSLPFFWHNFSVNGDSSKAWRSPFKRFHK